MKRSLLYRLGVACLLGLAVPAVVLSHSAEVVAAEPTAEEIGRRVQQFYDSSKTFQATFKQNYTIKVQNVQKVSTGKVVFEKPGKMSWTYDAPNGNRVVSDGTTIKVYEKENEQMYETSVKGSQYPAALAFLMGTGKLTKDFSLKLLNAQQMKFEGGYVLEGTPKEATPAYQKVLLYVDSATNQVRRVLILDAQGNRNRFDFSAPVVNQPVTKGEFEFTPPPGTRIVKP
ncbi:LolA family protein [Chondromyces apiculatus]|uniref:Outer membrane lipoprotein carrier protein LolA n=1 Tax=Chondromyces apiculatus DSM 436 TaxID=1192034 RepID=A0A017TEB5_9BACT|nr:outer membrane lipoprotein carrier protein LolA [Chondromyces apiculatus]EYF06951.1 Outer membrane lipoprotein carrier protein LolA [Chondromyces apiculatus DSM 436]